MDARLKRIWHGMKLRCYSKNAINFEYYGAKGITICSEWLLDFDNFRLIDSRVQFPAAP